MVLTVMIPNWITKTVVSVTDNMELTIWNIYNELIT